MEKYRCQTLREDKWKEIEMINEETGVEEIQDIVEREKEME